jgi:hypothetical protein
VGAAHIVLEEDVPVYWTGLAWEREKHSTLEQDEPHRHLPPGLIDLFVPDIRLRYVNRREITLEPVEGGAGRVAVAGEMISADPDRRVLNHLAAVHQQDDRIVFSYVEPAREYWIYLVNTASEAFQCAGLPGDGTHGPAPEWDYRGRLCLSSTAPINGYMALSGPGRNARLAGRTEMDGTAPSAGGPFFRRELNISLIGNRGSLAEAFRDYSDYSLEFQDENTLILRLQDGAYGQIAIADRLVYLGGHLTIATTGRRLALDEDEQPYVISGDLAVNHRYFIYLAGDLDEFNFNEVNPRTQRPWRQEDEDADLNYDPVIDFRHRPFLCDTPPDHGRLAETSPGYYTRWIGQVTTDMRGLFRPARDLSVIRRPQLDPTDLDGLAEIEFEHRDETEFRIVRRPGSSGVVNVGGVPVLTYESTDPNVHVVTTDDIVQSYDELSPTAPLSPLDAVSEHTDQQPLYLYLANARSLWGTFAARTFFCASAPVGGYLSRNWPGNQARWIADVMPSPAGEFTGTYIRASAAPIQVVIDDYAETSYNALSAAEIRSRLRAVWAEISAAKLYESQKRGGPPCRLEYVDGTHVRLVGIDDDRTVVFRPPEYQVVTLPPTGASLAISGTANTFRYVYFRPDGTLYHSADEPDYVVTDALCFLGADMLVGYLGLAAGARLAGEQGVYSHRHQPEMTWNRIVAAAGTTTLVIPGLCVPPGRTTQVVKTCSGSVSCRAQDRSSYYWCYGSASQSGTGTATTPFARGWCKYAYARAGITFAGAEGTLDMGVVDLNSSVNVWLRCWSYDGDCLHVGMTSSSVSGGIECKREGS